jgi:hypothetical protein
MKTVKKYTSFEELKSVDTKPVSPVTSLKKHTAFQKFIKSILLQKAASKSLLNTPPGR